MLVAIALGLITFAVRLGQIHQSLVGDEVFTYQDILGHSFRAVLTTVHTGGENSPPLFFLMAWATAKLGNPTVWIRLPSIILGAATLPVIYAIGRETVGRSAGLIAAAAIAVSPFSFYYGVEARPYAAMAFFVAVSTLAVLRAVATGRAGWWLAYAVAAAAAAYCHYTSIFLLAVQAIWALWMCRDRLRVPLAANVLIVVLYIPWLPHLRGKELAVIGGLEPLTVPHVLTDLVRLISGYPYASVRAIPTYVGLGVLIVCVAAGVIAVARRWRSWATEHAPSHLGLLCALAAATPVGLLLYSLLATDLWLARGLYASMPAAALVLGALLVAIPRPVSAITVVAVLVTLLAGTIRAGSEAYARPPFRTIAAYLDRVAPARDPVALLSITGQPAISAEFLRPHLQVPILAFWKSVPAGGNGYLVLDDVIARAVHLARVPRPEAGFVLRYHKHYPGLFPTEVLIYHRVSG